MVLTLKVSNAALASKADSDFSGCNYSSARKGERRTIPAKQAINLTDAFPSLSSRVFDALARESSWVLSIPPKTVKRSLRLESENCSRCRWRSVVEL